jgi:hypothetical protein
MADMMMTDDSAAPGQKLTSQARKRRRRSPVFAAPTSCCLSASPAASSGGKSSSTTLQSTTAATCDKNDETLYFLDDRLLPLDTIHISGTNVSSRQHMVKLGVDEGSGEKLAVRICVCEQLTKDEREAEHEQNMAELLLLTNLRGASPFLLAARGGCIGPGALEVRMLLPLMAGGDLMTLLRRPSSEHAAASPGGATQPELVVQFYLASILEGLEELHRRHIVHMDIKPENILLNGRGYAAITDLGCAVQLSDAEAGEYRVFPGGTWSEEATRCPAAAARPLAYASRRGTVNDLWLAAVRCARNAGSIFRPRSWAVEMWAAYRRRSQTVPHLIS